MGGQVGDTGEIVSRSGKFNVENTVLGPGGVVLHQGNLEEGLLSFPSS
jgi:alanyl-tRNA synthetase